MATIPGTLLLAAVREAGEVLAVRAGEDTTELELFGMGEFATVIRDQMGVRVVFIKGQEFARLKAGDAA
jgi:hypothetical protein